MRYLLLAALPLIVLVGCASNETKAPAPQAKAEPAPAHKAPQCYSGDHGKFFDVDAKAEIATVKVVCKKTADGKSAQWMSDK